MKKDNEDREFSVRTPPAMQALYIIAKLDPKQGESGTIICPGCGGKFNYYRGPTGKLSGSCESCRAYIPRG